MDDKQAWMLTERAKELECLYAVDEVLQNRQLTIPAAMFELARIIPSGFAYPEACRVRILLNGSKYEPDDFSQAKLINETPLKVGSEIIGFIEVGYILPLPTSAECAILGNEEKLLSAIGGRVSFLALSAQRELSILFDTLDRIDPDMLLRICEKLRVHLLNTAGDRIETLFGIIGAVDKLTLGEVNTPIRKSGAQNPVELIQKLIAAATMFLPSSKVSELVNGWAIEERAFSLIDSVDSKEAGIEQILEAVRRYVRAVNERGSNTLTETWLVVELCHRFLTHDEHFINLVIDNLKIADFESMIEKVIGFGKSRGNIGGKGSGLFIANQILSHAGKTDPLLADIKVPRTWYIATDQLVDFLRYNHLEEMRAYKYNSVSHLRLTYDNVVTKIKNGRLPPYIVQMLKILLDDLGDKPLIVRSSSLLEDSMTSTFSGKYKSLFLPNHGTRAQRLEELIDAILEVYSSMYNPDSILYRGKRGLLHFTEQMGVLIQEVVGTQIGPYFMPVLAGVAFSDNQLRWSTRVNREDGLVRMVMGLGTRAVDRVNDDYPLLFSPAKPGFRINQSPEDAAYYSPKFIDLINTQEQRFETLPIKEFLREYGGEIPNLGKLVSVYADQMMMTKNSFDIDLKRDNMVVTFDGVLSNSDIPSKLRRILTVLSDKIQMPVDIEFAYDGNNIFLLQCRAQSRGFMSSPAPIPQQLAKKDILFTANRFISNGQIQGITHIVYVDPDAYNSLATREDLHAVGRAIGLLGGLLPRRKYILMGPGRWGSRGDIKLGVRVTYSDICNCAALIEIAKEKHGYVPELSFGTHFFQDLVESNIVYIPLYPDQAENVFRQEFFMSSDNLLSEIMPEYGRYNHVIKVIDVAASTLGKTLFLHLNADLERAVAFFSDEKVENEAYLGEDSSRHSRKMHDQDRTWRWRQYMAEQIALEMDMVASGVKAVYLFGSTNTGQTHIGSDIDLLIHFDGNDVQRVALETWLQGWSKALAKTNFLYTGYLADTLLDAHIVTDADIESHDSFALKINSVTDPATLLRARD